MTLITTKYKINLQIFPLSKAKGDRNFHIFYFLLAGASEKERKELELQDISEYSIISDQKSNLILDVDGKIKVDDMKEMKSVRETMENVEIHKDMQNSIWRCLSAILALGNIKYMETTNQELVISNPEWSDRVARLLQVDAMKLNKSLCTYQRTVRGKLYESYLTVADANTSRDSLAKNIYEKLFQHIIFMVNTKLCSSDFECDSFVGLLDIFGFEIFEKNSFEQLCINYANEVLQKYFNEYIIMQEMEEYAAEEIPAPSITDRDNTPCVELIGRKVCIRMH